MSYGLCQHCEQMGLLRAIGRDVIGHAGTLDQERGAVQRGILRLMGSDMVHLLLLKHLLERYHRSCYTEER